MEGSTLRVLLLAVTVTLAEAKVYDKCELARELVSEYRVPESEAATWVCIAYHESRFNTSARGPTGDHGIFQISELYWCSPVGWACGVTCDSLRDDDIRDDFKCARRVYRSHAHLAGDGFTAWAVYAPHCASPDKTAEYVKGCFRPKTTSAKDGAKDSAKDTAKAGAKDPANDGAKDSAKGTANDGAKDSAKDTANDGAKDSTKDTANDGAKDSAKDTAKDATKDPAKDAATTEKSGTTLKTPGVDQRPKAAVTSGPRGKPVKVDYKDSEEKNAA